MSKKKTTPRLLVRERGTRKIVHIVELSAANVSSVKRVRAGLERNMDRANYYVEEDL